MEVPPGAIVDAVDSSSESEMGLRWAAEESVRSGLPLHLLHCLDVHTIEVPLTREQRSAMRANAEQLIEYCEKLAREWAGASVTSQILEMAPASALLQASHSARMVVLGARGHGLVYRMWLRSTSQQVTHGARCPVVVVRHDSDTAQERIVIGVDSSPASQRALGFAFQLARHRGAPVVAIHAWPDHNPRTFASGSPAWSHTTERIESGLQLLADSLSPWEAQFPEVETAMEALPVPPARALTAASEHASLVVVGAHRRPTFTDPRLGSVAQSVLHHARCPIAVVP